jgi:choline dehydrogenase-like flavoprotein
MITDLSTIRNDPFRNKVFDVCICGAGTAGITLALNLSENSSVLLLEAGHFESSRESQAIYKGEIVGNDYTDLTAARLRYFGGSSNHWAGECRPLDSHDFEPKSYAQFSGWPIRQSHLIPYLARAESILELSADDTWRSPSGYFEDKLNSANDFLSVKYRMSPPTRFGTRYRREIQRRSNISCFINANVTGLDLTDDLSKLRFVNVQTYAGVRHKAQARFFVLATGGMENPRILLNSDHQIPDGIGNQNGRVGQFFADHLYTKVADFILDGESRMFTEQYPFGDSFRGRLKNQLCKSDFGQDAVELLRGNSLDCLSDLRHFFSPTPEFMEKERTLNFSIRLRTRTPDHRQDMDGKLMIVSEQAMNPLSRISLGTETDRFGLRRIRLDWRILPIDMHTLQRAVIRFGENFAALNLGRIKVSEWLLAENPEYNGGHGSHHMCSTRMAASADEGVVDSNQKVFDVDNLYIAGSSVFSTGGQANPTFTIVQMTLRLADHINNRRKTSG